MRRLADEINYHTRQNSAYRSGHGNSAASACAVFVWIRNGAYAVPSVHKMHAEASAMKHSKMPECGTKTENKACQFTKEMPKITVIFPEKNAAREQADNRRYGKMLREIIQDSLRGEAKMEHGKRSGKNG